MKKSVCCAAMLVVLLPAKARAEDEAPPHKRFELAAGAAYIAASEPDRFHHFGGVGSSFAMALIPHLLSVELVGHVLFAASVTALPVDLQLKVERPVSETVSPYVMLGPTVVPEIEHDESKVWVGLSSAVGCDVWLTTDVGVMAELNANALLVHGVRPELGAFAGPVARF